MEDNAYIQNRLHLSKKHIKNYTRYIREKATYWQKRWADVEGGGMSLSLPFWIRHALGLKVAPLFNAYVHYSITSFRPDIKSLPAPSDLKRRRR